MRLTHEIGLSYSTRNGREPRFLHPSQWRFLDFDAIFALNWKHTDDQIAEWRHKSRKCAEVLVPGRVEPRFLIGARVIDAPSEVRLRELGFKLPVQVDPVLFFRQMSGA